jgi:hypothetical protein
MSKRDDDTLTRSEIELARSKAAKAGDKPLYDKVDQMLEALRREREENHWAARVKQAWQEGR